MKKLDVSLQADEPLRTGLLRVAETLIQNAIDRLRYPSCDLGGDIHFVRVMIKRLRALVRLIRPAISEMDFGRVNLGLKKAACRLSFARDSDVALQTLAKLGFSKPSERDAVASMLVNLSGNEVHRSEVNKAMNQIKLDLEQARGDLGQIQISGSEWMAIGPGLRKVYRQCQKRMRRAFSEGNDESFHKWRIRAKNLFYELQMLRPVWPERLDKMIAGLNQLQEEIGADHDLVILKRSLKTPDTFDGDEKVAKFVSVLVEKSKKIRRQLEPLGRSIFDQKSGEFVDNLGQHWSEWRKPRMQVKELARSQPR